MHSLKRLQRTSFREIEHDWDYQSSVAWAMKSPIHFWNSKPRRSLPVEKVIEKTKLNSYQSRPHHLPNRGLVSSANPRIFKQAAYPITTPLQFVSRFKTLIVSGGEQIKASFATKGKLVDLPKLDPSPHTSVCQNSRSCVRRSSGFPSCPG